MPINLISNNLKETIAIKIQMKIRIINKINIKTMINMRDLMMMILSIKRVKIKCTIDQILIMQTIHKTSKLRMPK